MGGGPIFIVGAMGSGTTLLRLMLDSHPRIAVPHETGFMRSLNAQLYAPFKHSGGCWAQRLGFTDAELDAELAAFYDRLFMRYAERHAKQRWGEKTPLHTWHIETMARVFGDAQIVGMVRHPLGSVASNLRRFTAGMPKHAKHWEKYSREIAVQALRHGDRMVVLRYEDLVLRPEAVLRPLLEWLGEPWDDAVLAHHEVQSERGGKLQVEGKSRVDDPVDVSRISKWQEVLDAEQQEWLGRRLRALGEFWGYAVDDPAVLEPLGASPVAHAADIEARASAHPAVDVREPGRPSPFEQFYDPRKVTLVKARKGKKIAAKPSANIRAKRAGQSVRDRVAPVLRRAWAALKRG